MNTTTDTVSQLDTTGLVQAMPSSTSIAPSDLVEKLLNEGYGRRTIQIIIQKAFDQGLLDLDSDLKLLVVNARQAEEE